MARKKSPITDYAFEDEEGEAGRLLGVAAKADRASYEQFKQIASTRGMKVSEAVNEALRLWTLSKTLQGVDTDAMIAAINFVNYMHEQSVKELLALGKLFTSEFFKVQTAIIKETSAQMAPPAPPAEEPTKGPSPDDLIRQQMKAQMLQAILPTYVGVIQQVLKMLGGATGMPINLPTTQPTTTQTKRPLTVEE